MVWAWPFDGDADLALVACSLAVLLSLLALILLVVQELSSPQSLPLHLTRRIFAAHLFACLFLELRKPMVWSDFATWTLALHTLFFGLCERGQPLFTRILHGPSFGGSHAVLVIYLFTLLKGGAWSLWGWWLHIAPCILHWADGMLNFRALLKAYSPPVHSTNSWESAGHFGPALYFAASRMTLRAWSAGVGYVLLEKIFTAATQPAQAFEWDWSLHKLLQVTDVKEVLPLASTIMAYTAFTHRLFVTPESSEGKRP
mmetsp:Transcript_28123/g.45218  ORF Transcript_28123/g.45218 Transcript_28123/m.45218 type:complete len:257 (-) Transcript_28123:13-783(-)